MSTSEFYLSITPLKLSEIPSEDVIIKAGREVLNDTANWKHGKSFHKNTVKTLSRKKGPKDGAAWHARVSEHDKDEVTFEEFWDKLGKDKANNEMQYIPEIEKVQLIKQISQNQSVWTLFYKFPPPVSPRVFTVVQTIWFSETSPRTGIVVSVPVDVSGDPEAEKLEEKGVKGRYASVERILELDNGKVEWRMATSSTPGGNIPVFIAESSIPGSIANDVKHFLGWLKGVRGSKKADESATGDVAPAATAEVHAAAAEESAVPNAAAAEASAPGAAAGVA
ncbi:hypothetical protein BD310DRAFT_836448 [Dichomitus squalens]|uniref:DUF3074 domain-containing protein n=1 Tax=Dichomitus squalens TaxID=114155 RepID=A0A4Q9QE83_9APHY|nr:hypothetical protein BD310DRAFT_836448 [Dichomitus squalens]